MKDQERFDRAMGKILSVSKAEMQRRLEEAKQKPRIGLKRGPKPASRAPASYAQN